MFGSRVRRWSFAVDDILPFAIAMVVSGMGTAIASFARVISEPGFRGLTGLGVGLTTSCLGVVFILFRDFGDNPSPLWDDLGSVVMLIARIVVGPLVALALWRDSGRSLVTLLIAFVVLVVVSVR